MATVKKLLSTSQRKFFLSMRIDRSTVDDNFEINLNFL